MCTDVSMLKLFGLVRVVCDGRTGKLGRMDKFSWTWNFEEFDKKFRKISSFIVHAKMKDDD